MPFPIPPINIGILGGGEGEIPIQTPLALINPMVASTHTAQVVILYTKTSGKYVAPRQQ